MPQLDPTWFVSQIFWLVLTFTLLYIVLSQLVLPPLLEVMTLRKETLDSDIDTAQRLKTQAEDAKALYEKALAEARERSQAVMDEAVKKHKAAYEQSMRDMDARISGKISEAESRIHAQKQELMQALTPMANELSQSIISKITGGSNHKDNSKRKTQPLAKGNG